MDKKYYVIFAGVNGAGKSSTYRLLANDSEFWRNRVNSDEILRDMGGDWRNPADQAKAMKEAIKRIDYNFKNGISFNQETTLTGRTALMNIKRAKELGYTVTMYYVGVKNADVAIQRVEKRVKQGGHGVSETDVRRRYEGSLQNLVQAIPMCDYVRIYDNTDRLRKIAVFENGRGVERVHNCSWFPKCIQMQSMIQVR